MFRKVLLAGLLAVTSVPAMAAGAPYSSAETTIGSLLDDPAAKAVLDKHMPGFAGNPQIEMARSMTLKQIQGFAPDQIKDEVLAKIDVDLAKLPAKP
ncbi:MAG: hypothetical protein ACKOVA_20245 [Novosphingobium sp.]